LLNRSQSTKRISISSYRKMFSKILALIFWIILIYKNESLSPKDLCILTYKKCNESLLNQQNCQQQQQHQQSECNLYPYIYKCGPDKCAKNKAICDDLTTIRRYLSSTIFKSNMAMPMHMNVEILMKRKLNFQKFETKIKECTKQKVYYAFQMKDICMRRKKCYTTSHRLDGKIRKQAYIKTDCPCDGKHSYECEKDFCTPNVLVCNVVRHMREINSQRFDSIQRCNFFDF